MTTKPYHHLQGQACAGVHLTLTFAHELSTAGIITPIKIPDFLKKVRSLAKDKVLADLTSLTLQPEESDQFLSGANETLNIL